MGTRELAERELIQGVIKLAAAFVHEARGNPAGIEKNLRGARARVAAGVEAGGVLGIDVAELLRRVDARLAMPGGQAIAIPRPNSGEDLPAAGG
jgi:hypothetical protein